MTMANTPHDDSEQKNGTRPAPEQAAAQPAAAAAPPDAQPAAQPPSPEETIAALRAETAELKDKLLRAHAEVENIRKRSEREREDTSKYAITRFARDIIGLGDNFRRAIDAVPAGAAEQDPALKSFLDGVVMTERELFNVLERYGIKRVQPLNEAFNPHLHQAVMEVQRTDVPAGTVVQVFQAGYTIEERVLRPAMVAVSKGGAKAAQAAEAAPGSAVPPAANENPSA